MNNALKNEKIDEFAKKEFLKMIKFNEYIYWMNKLFLGSLAIDSAIFSALVYKFVVYCLERDKAELLRPF